MGVQGLLPQLKPIQQPITLARYQGQTLAIDGYAWLHRAAHSCAEDLALDLPSTRYLEFFVKRLDMLRNRFHINPYLVFDGDAITVKKDTEVKRRQKRVENREKALALWKSGDKRQAYEYFQKSVDVTPEMAKCIIEYCQTQSIQYVVAPFEADAQMVYLENKGMAHGIISEDSDLLIFGCRKLITKLNDHGEAVEICRDDFTHLPSKFPLFQLSPEQTRAMVCLSGCDYTAGIPKVGLLTAIKLVKKFKTIDKIILNIQREGRFTVPKDFADEYQLATFAFQFQRVYCPERREVTTLNEIPLELKDCQALFSCIGKVVHKTERVKRIIINNEDIDHELHGKIAAGEICPYNFEKALINRERKLQLTAKSEPIISIPATSNTKSIDSFFSKSASVSVSATPQGGSAQIRAATRIQEQKLLESKRKLQSTVERRKLSRHDMPTSNSASSKFFNQSNRPSERSMSTKAISMSVNTPIAERLSSQLEEQLLESDVNLVGKGLTSQSSDAVISQEDIPTDIPSSLASTEIPSSMLPTQIDQDSVPFSEEESESLSEVEEPAKTDDIRANQKKRHCASLAGLRESFSYGRAPLRERDPNTVVPSTKSKHPDSKVQRPSLKRSNHYVASPSSTGLQRNVTRTLSLSDFIYRGQ
ncbi:LANO_0B04522g1_1 [Lachancea nothofagi CBS 11611]|uniref:LANO_0B04522g1_1 n=1 Tax=Lachancea nothofagi CBS 11611 TaxID=1266666 RepID=A0A1G4IXP3_9SACH|nr:LANO_0B04522g1_1 [Lachancea nothofagi CBS 11611]